MPQSPSAWSIIPFGILLLAIAIGSALFHTWWNKHYPKLTLSLAAITLVYYLFAVPNGTDAIFHTAHEYFGFIALIASLYVVSGGIHIHVGRESTPGLNVGFLFIGAVLANFLGTTGASMLLIRPWLRLNQHRAAPHHVVFFIFIISNIGGCLTPIGDPPLFLGYLRGVPFWWVAQKCWPMWLLGVGLLLVVFFAIDRRNYRQHSSKPDAQEPKLPHETNVWRFDGLANIGCLAVILAAVFVSKPMFLRELIMIAAAIVSWFTTNKRVHEANHYNWHPVIEVIILFAAIFITMMPALDWLQNNAQHVFGAPHAGTYYWSCGILSSVLDNAPTYLACFAGVFGSTYPGPSHLDPVLIAISVAAVFFGANTYIGNGPNFMVRSISGHRKFPCPTFIGYILKWTFPVMIPLLAILWAIFFRS
jgi:Na+/H+ antiporter NhaD/arsenite permease-like protein